MSLVQSNFLAILVISLRHFFLKVGQKVIEIIFFYSKLTFFINEDANSFSVFFEIGIRDRHLFFRGNYSIPINISSSSFNISGSSFGFLLHARISNDDFGFNDEARFIVDGKILLELFTI